MTEFTIDFVESRRRAQDRFGRTIFADVSRYGPTPYRAAACELRALITSEPANTYERFLTTPAKNKDLRQAVEI